MRLKNFLMIGLIVSISALFREGPTLKAIIVYCARRAKAGFCAPREKLSPEAKPRSFQLDTRHKRPFSLDLHILFCSAVERKRVFAFENIRNGFEVTDVLLVAMCANHIGTAFKRTCGTKVRIKKQK